MQVYNFSSGLTLIAIPIKGIKTVTVMTLFRAGSKYEKKNEEGMAHFIEHMLFNGTKQRPSVKEVAEVLDNVGGTYNAFTSKEYVGYYAKVGESHFDLALSWISDLITHPLLEEKMIEKEKKVITEEINMCEDTPMDKVNELMETLLYGNQPAGWSIAGRKETINQFTRDQLLKFKQENYTQKNCVVCVSGCFNKTNLKKKVLQFFKDLPCTKNRTKDLTKEKQIKPQSVLQKKETDQTHLVLAFRTFSLFSKKKYALAILSNILGSGMSSRLFLEIREKRGLAYYVNVSPELYSDSGYLSIQAGLDHKNVTKTIKITLEELKKISLSGITFNELKKAQENIYGHSLIGLESSNTQAIHFGIQKLLKGEIETITTFFQKIKQVTQKDVKKLAKEIFRKEKLNLAIIGPHKNLNLKKILKKCDF